jgi:RNA polymerase sigma factor (sigma-70 family)
MSTGWVEQNTWWREMAKRMTDKTANLDDWQQANRRLWCLSFVAARTCDISAEERRDLVQEMLLRLQNAVLAIRLTGVDTPALKGVNTPTQYIAKMMRNHLEEQARRTEKSRHAAKRHAEDSRRPQEEPDQEASRNEQAAKANHVVNNLLSEADRDLLVWFYFDNIPARKIARRLKIGEAAVWKRLTRARRRCRDAFNT